MDGKFTLTLYDTVSHLIPGVVLLLTINYFSSKPIIPQDFFLFYLLFFGYITGLVLHMIGLLIFYPFFPSTYSQGSFRRRLVKEIERILRYIPLLRMSRADGPIKDLLPIMIKKKYGIDYSKNRLGLFAFCDTFVATVPFPERDTLAAKEGLFRSLTVLAVVEAFYLLFFTQLPRIQVALAGLLFVEIFRYGREYYRTIKNQQIYTVTFLKHKK